MPWNNGYERRKFDEEQKRLAKLYREAGMSEEQIEAMYQFDLEEFHSRRRFREHNQQPPQIPLEDDPEGVSPLNEKFLMEMSVLLEQSSERSRNWWIEEIDDPVLADKLKQLPEDARELLTLLVYEQYSQSEVAVFFGIGQRAVSKRLDKIRRMLKEG